MCRSALSEGRRWLVELWLQVDKLQMSATLMDFLHNNSFHVGPVGALPEPKVISFR